MVCSRTVVLILCLCSGVARAAEPAKPFGIHVVDEATGRGVPCVELRSVPDQIFMTDSHGYAAIDDPVLMGRKAFFHVHTDGYEYPKPGLGGRGVALQVTPGGEATIRIKRINIAERLYRITGAGIYRDSVLLRKPVPIEHPLLNAEVCGQDTVQTAVRGDKIYWFWGDTDRLGQSLGNFNTSGATSLLPGQGGLEPDQGINLTYFEENGFCRPMFPRENGILIWVHGMFTATDPTGRERIVTHYSRRESLAKELSSGLAVLNDETNLFETIHEYQPGDLYPRGQSFTVERDGVRYVYFAEPYALVRVRAEWDAIVNPAEWETFTPAQPGGGRSRGDQIDIERDSAGVVHYRWVKNARVIGVREHQRLVQSGALKEEENRLRTVDAATGAPILLHAGSIKWNPYRKRWIMIAHQTMGKPSFLGEVWYSEALQPEGPCSKAVKLATHEKYSFYNITQHDFFDREAGRLVYFEGTYTNLFTQNVKPTPWYDYNQIMYRLDLSDERLAPAFARE